MPTGLQALNSVRLTGIMQALQDVRDLPKQLTFLSRTPIVPATDNEIMARTIDRVYIADIIANDQEALVYQTGKLSFESTVIPNLKLGVQISQDMLNQLNSLSGLPTMRGVGGQQFNIFDNYRNRKVEQLLLGVRQRMEALIVGMQIDSVQYDRLGIKVTGSFGMPADLKVTVSPTWDTAASATPANDILGLKLVGNVRYGINFNRVKMATAAFRYMIATTEFQAKARMYLAPNVSYTNLAIANLSQQQQIAESVLGMTIELYDSRFWTQGRDGTNYSQPFLPINKVILDSTENDNDANIMDFGNAEVSEGLVASTMPTSIVGGSVPQGFGPVSYATAPPDLNPPTVTMWGVGRGFPRKKMLQATAVLTVGTFTDQIPNAEPPVI